MKKSDVAQSTGNENSGKGAFSFGISGGFSTVTGGYSGSIGVFVGATSSGIYITKKKGKGVALSISLDGTAYRSKTGNYVELNDLSYKGSELDFGAWVVGYSLGNNGYVEYDGSIVSPTYNSHTISISDGMDFGYSDWRTESIVIPKTPWIGILIPKLPW